jgi:hypothetical protein
MESLVGDTAIKIQGREKWETQNGFLAALAILIKPHDWYAEMKSQTKLAEKGRNSAENRVYSGNNKYSSPL